MNDEVISFLLSKMILKPKISKGEIINLERKEFKKLFNEFARHIDLWCRMA